MENQNSHSPGGQRRRSSRGANKDRRRGRSRTNHKPRKLSLESLEGRKLLSADVGLRYEFDLNGVAVTSLVVGNTYTLNAYIRDNRGTAATGVLQAYFDIDYTSSVVTIPSGQGVTAGPQFDWANGGNVSATGEILGAGGESTYRVPPSPTDEEQLLFSVPVTVESAGTLTISTIVDNSSGNDVITFFPDSQPPTVPSMSDVEVDGLTNTTLNGSTVTGTFPVLAAGAGVATHYVLSAPASATAGTPVNVTVTAEDAYGNTCPSYTGTVNFTSSDAQAVLPASTTLTNGVGTFSVTLKTAGSQTFTATDSTSATIFGSSSVSVSPAAATRFVLSAPASTTAGNSISVSVTAKDAYGNTATGYAGTLHFTSSDPQAALPSNSTLSSGTGTFNVTLKTSGSQTITATDTANGLLGGSSSAIGVSSAAATHLVFSVPTNVTAGSSFTFTVTAEDAYNNTAIGYGGTVHFTSGDVAAVLPASSTLSGGVGTFNATLKTAGSQTITGTDISTGSIAGTSAAIVVGAATATRFTVACAATATAGSALSLTVTALDAYNNTATGYSGTVHFTSNDPAAALPANATLMSGVGTFSVTLKTAGSRTVTATDSVNGSITGVSGAVQVNAAAVSHFVVSAAATSTAGSTVSVTVTAEDPYGNTATNYAGTIHFTSSDAAAVLPGNSGLANGAATFNATLKTAGSQTITVTDTANSSLTGSSGAVTVSAAAAAQFVVSAGASTTAGSPVTFTVTAFDAYNNIATGYAGTVHFTSNDPSAVLPANTTLTNGAGTFSATLETAGSRTLTATDTVAGSITGTSGAVTVSPAAATHFVVSAPSSTTAGSAITLTVTAKDAYNNTTTGYTGTVHFTSSDAAAVLPANSTLTNGAGSFSVTLKTAGSQTITATDTVTSSITGSSGTVTVSPGAATHFAITAPATATAGTSFTFTVVAEDAYNNKATGYTGTVAFTSSDPAAVLPANSAVPGGQGSFNITLKTSGSRTITVTDTSNSSITGTSSAVSVAAGAATHFLVSAPASAIAGVAATFTVTAEDAYNNTAANYTGTVHFTSSDPAAALPANGTLTFGSGSFSATLKTSGSQTITATDTANSSLTGSSAAVHRESRRGYALHPQRTGQQRGRVEHHFHHNRGRRLQQHRDQLRRHRPFHQQRPASGPAVQHHVDQRHGQF